MTQSWTRAAILILNRLQHTKVLRAEQFTATLNPVRAWRTVLQSGAQQFTAMVRGRNLHNSSARYIGIWAFFPCLHTFSLLRSH